MAGALKRKQRSHRSFYENRKVLGSVATYRSNSMVWKPAEIKQMFKSQKGDK